MNLLYPFAPADTPAFEQACQAITSALANTQPFRITLSQFNSFRHSARSFTLWLDPCSTGGWRTTMLSLALCWYLQSLHAQACTGLLLPALLQDRHRPSDNPLSRLHLMMFILTIDNRTPLTVRLRNDAWSPCALLCLCCTELVQLQSALYSALPQYNDLNEDATRGTTQFTPHLSLGQFKSAVDLESVQQVRGK